MDRLIDDLKRTSQHFYAQGDIKSTAVVEAITDIVEKHDGWISVDERLPSESGEYLVWFGCDLLNQKPRINLFKKETGCFVYNNVGITHWQPLPEPPKGE